MGRLSIISAIAMVLIALPSGAQAQSGTTVEAEECRCLDRSGEEIENCICVMRRDGPGINRFFQVRRGADAQIGVTVSTDQDGMYDRTGVHLRSVQEGTPAYEAGLRSGDIVIALDGTSVLSPLDAEEEQEFDSDGSVPVQRFLTLASDFEVGESVDVTYVRDGEESTITVIPQRLSRFALRGGSRLSQGNLNLLFPGNEDLVLRYGLGSDEDSKTFMLDLDENALRDLGDNLENIRLFSRRGDARDPETTRVFDFFGGVSGGSMDGVEFVSLTDQLADYFGVSGGVLVSEVDEDSPLGLSAGDVVTGIDGREIEDTRDMRRILGSYQADENLTVQIVRRGEAMEVRGSRR